MVPGLAAFTAALIVGLLAVASSAGATTVLSTTSLGPLKLGMSADSAEETGWIDYQGPWCDELYSPAPDLYTLDGESAPDGLRGYAYFRNDRLRNILVERGAQTTLGIAPGRSTTREMVRRYRSAGYKATARYSKIFRGTHVLVKRGGKQLFDAFAPKGKRISALAIPYVPICE